MKHYEMTHIFYKTKTKTSLLTLYVVRTSFTEEKKKKKSSCGPSYLSLFFFFFKGFHTVENGGGAG